MRVLPLAILVAVAGATTPLHARKPCRLPTAESLAGAWVAVGDYGDHFRIEIEQSGQGHFGIRTTSGGTHTYAFSSIDFDGYKIQLDAQNNGEEQPRLYIRGEAPCLRLELTFKLWRHKNRLRCFREAEWRAAQEELGAAMRASEP